MSWILEKEAAQLLNRAPRTLRRLVKSGALKIQFTHVNNRTYQYRETDLKKVLNKNASVHINRNQQN